MEQEQTNKEKIVIIVEDVKLQDYIALLLMGEGYTIQTYGSADEFQENINQEDFDLAIIDLASDRIDGLKICKIIRNNLILRLTPVIILMPDKNPIDKAKVIYSGADDYIEKSLLAEDLLLRVKASLWRVDKNQDRNPLTKLPGISKTIKELEGKINSSEQFAVAYLDLFKLRKFNDRYGFRRGDEVIIYTAGLLRNTLLGIGASTDFLSHLGGDDFMFITSPENIDIICRKIIQDFDDGVLSFYDTTDRQNKCIFVRNRQGRSDRCPILRISIGVVSSTNYPLTSTAQIIQVSSELKEYAKQFEKSIYVKERRKAYPFY